MGGGKGGGGGEAPFQSELAGMYAGQNMINMAQRNPYAASLFRPGSELGDAYKKMFGTSSLPEYRPFRLDPIGSYSMAASRIYGGAQPELNMPSVQQERPSGGFLPGSSPAQSPMAFNMPQMPGRNFPATAQRTFPLVPEKMGKILNR